MHARRFGEWTASWLVAALCGSIASRASAHAPQGRTAAVSADGASAAIALPGFGLLLRTKRSPRFAYLCDALLGNQPSDAVPTLAFLADGSLLMGAADGVRVITPDGCPLAAPDNPLSRAVVIALAADPGASRIAYAVTGRERAGLWRSEDGGRTWTMRSRPPNADTVSALLIDAANPDQIYLSENTTVGHSAVLMSSDRGATFSTFDQERALSLLHSPGGVSQRFWAMARSADNTTNRGFDILHATSAAGPWGFALRVNYFGGFSVDPHGSISIGDEGGGVYRSSDGGDTFTNVAPDTAVACLSYAHDAWWACTPGTNQQPALSIEADDVDAGPTFDGVVAFSDVDQLVDCGADVDVAKRCAAAWIEWRRDVLMQDVSMDAGASVPSDAGRADAAQPDASVVAAAPAAVQPEAAVEVTNPAARARRGGCSVSASAAQRAAGWWFGSPLLLAWCARRAFRRCARRVS
jgi:hypothetical protein